MIEGISIRALRQEDDRQLGEIIRDCFLDFGGTQQGTVFADPVIDKLSVSFSGKRSCYFVLEKEGKLLGGAGIQHLKGADPSVCELQKMYISKEGRGKGLGALLMKKCLEFAAEAGYRHCYLESLPEFEKALKLYERSGFKYIDHRMGDTGYYGCSLFMLYEL